MFDVCLPRQIGVVADDYGGFGGLRPPFQLHASLNVQLPPSMGSQPLGVGHADPFAAPRLCAAPLPLSSHCVGRGLSHATACHASHLHL